MNPDLQHCPICIQYLPVSEFGICRARKSGRNLYCKSCIREKVTASRRALKEYKQARKNRQVDQYWNNIEPLVVEPKPVPEKSAVDRVRDAIDGGARTQREIERKTKLGKDVIGDALATLLLWTNEIRTQLIGDTRFYFRKETTTEQFINYPRSSSLVDVARKHCGPVVRGTKEIRRIA